MRRSTGWPRSRLKIKNLIWKFSCETGLPVSPCESGAIIPPSDFLPTFESAISSRFEGDFYVSPSFGLEARNWKVRFLTAAEKTDLLAGPANVQEKQSSDYSAIESLYRVHSGSPAPRIMSFVSARIWRSAAASGRRTQLSSRQTRRIGGARRANDAGRRRRSRSLPCLEP